MRRPRSPSRTSRRRAGRRCRATSRAAAGRRRARRGGSDGSRGAAAAGSSSASGIIVRNGVVAQPVAGRIGRQAELGARRVHRRRGQLDRERLDRRQPERDAHDRDPVELGDERGGVLPAVSRTITSGRQSSTIARRPGSAAAVSMRAKYSPIITALAVSRSICAELAEQRHPLLRRRLAERARTAGRPARRCPRAGPAPRRAPRARRAARRARTGRAGSGARRCRAW